MPDFNSMNRLLANVILPLPVEGTFTYLLPGNLNSGNIAGRRVVVSFGKKKIYTGIIRSVSVGFPNDELKEVISVLDDEQVVSEENLKLWEWIAGYYCCTVGEVMNAALPSGLKPESSTKVALCAEPDYLQLDENELELISRIGNNPTPIEALQKILPPRALFRTIESLIKKKYITAEEEVAERYKAKIAYHVTLSPQIKTEQELNERLSTLKKAKKQEELLLRFCSLSGVFSEEIREVARKDLLKETLFSPVILKELIRKGILAEHQKIVSRLDEVEETQSELNLLNPYQEEALANVKSVFSENKVALLHGITSSGKTEIYIHLIREAIEKGQQVLYLVPEIALTTQLVSRLKKVFGTKAGVYHSRLNDAERTEIWEKVKNFSPANPGTYQIILGARSSVLLPYKNLGLVVVDEEHEPSYKQFDPAPRYHARDVAVVVGSIAGCNVLLGSATPSFESYFNTRSGKFGLVELTQRHGNLELPDVVVSDLQQAYKRKQMKSVLAPELYRKICESLKNQEQVILFQNRRGYAPFVECMGCGWIPKCQNCDVSLVYHKFSGRLNCHYCGYSAGFPERCPVCGSADIKTRGLGTEKVEDELQKLFPEARIARMDLDSTRRKNAIGKIVAKLENHETDILVGTQMVAKGLDFEHVQIVGILNADNQLNFPDFRAHERSFQLFSQVSGRAGRKHRKGEVVIQTSQPNHPVIADIKNNDYPGTFERQMEERQLFKYPPYYRLIAITVKHRDEETMHKAAFELASFLRENKKLLILGPQVPLIGRIKLWYHEEIRIKLNRDSHLVASKMYIKECIAKTNHLPGNSGVVFSVDVDPA